MGTKDTKIGALMAMVERLKEELGRSKDSLTAYERSIATYREQSAKDQTEINRLTNELAAAKIGRFERVVRGLRDAFLAATEEDAATRPFSLTR